MSHDPIDVDAYLRRTGADRPLAPSREALARLHQAHVESIPFENLDLLLGRPIAIDLPALQAKLVDARRGGYCLEQNTLFQAVLEALGYEVTALAARVRAGTTAIRPRTHMLLVVELSGSRCLVDVGFGGDGPLHPLPLEPGRETWVGATGHRLREEAGTWILEGHAGEAWTDLYAFTLEPQHAVDFVMANHFTSTWPASPFLGSLTVQRSFPERRVVLRNRGLFIRQGRVTEASTIRDPDHLLEVLEHHFDLAFPPGTRFSKPEFEGEES